MDEFREINECCGTCERYSYMGADRENCRNMYACTCEDSKEYMLMTAEDDFCEHYKEK
jgi:hypothetical protein